MTDKIEKLKKLDNNKLIDIVKNYRQYGYDDNLRASAITILEDRGITKEELQLTGNFENRTYDVANDWYKSFRRNSKIAFILYGILLFTKVLSATMSVYSEFLETLTSIIYWGALIFYLVFFVKSFLNKNQFYKIIKQEYGAEGALVYFFLGMPFYIIMYFYFKNQMEEKMKGIK